MDLAEQEGVIKVKRKVSSGTVLRRGAGQYGWTSNCNKKREISGERDRGNQIRSAKARADEQ